MAGPLAQSAQRLQQHLQTQIATNTRKMAYIAEKQEVVGLPPVRT
jgi:hypothetical protein